MNEFEEKLLNALGGEGQFDPLRSDTVREEVLRVYDRKLKTTRIVTCAFLGFFVLIMAYMALLFLTTSDTKIMIACGVVFLMALGGTDLVKLWYWTMNTKFSVLKELKELQLQIAELSQKVSPSEG